MSLIFFDSLDYASAAIMADMYGSSAGWTVGASHPEPWRASAQVSQGVIVVPKTNPAVPSIIQSLGPDQFVAAASGALINYVLGPTLFQDAGFEVGMQVDISGFDLGNNNSTRTIDSFVSQGPTGQAMVFTDNTGMVDELGSGDELVTHSEVTDDEATCLVGFMVGSSNPPTDLTPLLVVKSTSGTIQLRVFLRPDLQGGHRVEVWSGNQRRRLLVSAYFSLSDDRYVEIGARITSNGQLSVRLDGVVDSYVEGVDLASGTNGWGSVEFDVDAGGSYHIRLADVYVASGTDGFKPPGRVSVARMWPWELKTKGFQWGLQRKPRLVVMLGQSNMNGRGDDPPTTQARNPNSVVTIWNVENQVFEFIDANTNTGSAFSAGQPEFGAPWGPEMMFAEMAALLHQATGATDTSQTFIVKMAVDASWVSPLLGTPSWHPSLLNNLSDSAIAEINAAVTSLGGWGLFSDIDIFWHQGESEAISATYPDPYSLYTDYTNAVFDHFEAQLSSTTIHWHRTVMHEDTLPAIFAGKEAVINQQRRKSLRGSQTETSDLGLISDGIHLDIAGFDKLGIRYFQKWMERILPVQESSKILDTLLMTAVDTDHVGGTAGASMTAEQKGEYKSNLVHSPGLALSSKSYTLSDVGESLEISVGGVSLPDVPVPLSGSYALDFTLKEVSMSPESLTGDVKFTLK